MILELGYFRVNFLDLVFVLCWHLVHSATYPLCPFFYSFAPSRSWISQEPECEGCEDYAKSEEDHFGMR